MPTNGKQRSQKPAVVVNVPDNGELYVPLELAATHADFTHDVTVTMAQCAAAIHSNNIAITRHTFTSNNSCC